MNKDLKKTAVPKLRFPEFREEWDVKSLGEIAVLINEKAGSKQFTLMSISAGIGLVSQIEKFGREIAGDSYPNYYVIRKGDFAYNKSSTKQYPEGQIAVLENEETGAVPNSIFTCFRVDDKLVSPFFIKYPFENNIHGKWLKNFIEVGARAHGALSVDTKDLFSTPIHFPSLAEQKKLATFLTTLDTLVSAEQEKLRALQAHKKGLMQVLFPGEGEVVPRVRFGEFEDAGDWEETTLKGVCKMQAGKFVSASDIFEKRTDELFPCYGGNGLRGYTKSFTHTGNYSLIGRQGALCGNVTLATGKFHATEHAVVVTPKKEIDTVWLFYLLNFLNLNQYATGQAQPGLSVENLEKVEIKVPKDEKEQQKIATCLTALDALLSAQQEKLAALKRWKTGLMQRVFPKANDPDA